MHDDAEAWFAAHTSVGTDWPRERLLAAKGDARVSVVLPALNEEPTVGRIVASIHPALGAGVPSERRLVDELVASSHAKITGAPALVLGCLTWNGLDRYPDVTRQRSHINDSEGAPCSN